MGDNCDLKKKYKIEFWNEFQNIVIQSIVRKESDEFVQIKWKKSIKHEWHSCLIHLTMIYTGLEI